MAQPPSVPRTGMRPLKYAHASFAQIVNHLASPRLCPTKRERNTKSRNRKTKSTKNAEYEVLFVLFVSALCLLCSVPFPVGQSSVAATFDFRAHATRVSGSGTIVHPASQILLIHLRPSTHFIAHAWTVRAIAKAIESTGSGLVWIDRPSARGYTLSPLCG